MFTLEFSTENAAFCHEETSEDDVYSKIFEIKRILNNIASKIDVQCTSGPIIDYNGNKIGDWRLNEVKRIQF